MSSRFGAVVDLFAVLVALAVAVGVVFVTPLGGVLRVAAVLPAILFLPGYALVSALYPDRSGDPDDRGDEGWSLNAIERAGLAVAASVAIVPLIALVSNFTSYGVRAEPVLGGTAVVTVLLTLAALDRRLRLDADRRYRVTGDWLRGSVGRYLTAGRPSLDQRTPFEARTSGQRLMNLLLVGAVLLLVSSVAYAAVGPQLPSEDGSFTELYLLGDDGDRLLGSEAALADGGSVPFTVAVENHENERTRYTVVVQRQQASRSGNRTVVSKTTEVGRTSTTVADGETARLSQTVRGGEHVRVRVLLYRGDAPANPTGDDAYRVTRFWPAGPPAGGGSA